MNVDSPGDQGVAGAVNPSTPAFLAGLAGVAGVQTDPIQTGALVPAGTPVPNGLVAPATPQQFVALPQSQVMSPSLLL